MTKAELILQLYRGHQDLTVEDCHRAVDAILAACSHQLATGGRIEIRGFGGFHLRHMPQRVKRNPRTGQEVLMGPASFPKFKPGKELRERVNKALTPSRLEKKAA